MTWNLFSLQSVWYMWHKFCRPPDAWLLLVQAPSVHGASLNQVSSLSQQNIGSVLQICLNLENRVDAGNDFIVGHNSWKKTCYHSGRFIFVVSDINHQQDTVWSWPYKNTHTHTHNRMVVVNLPGCDDCQQSVSSDKLNMISKGCTRMVSRPQWNKFTRVIFC